MKLSVSKILNPKMLESLFLQYKSSIMRVLWAEQNSQTSQCSQDGFVIEYCLLKMYWLAFLSNIIMHFAMVDFFHFAILLDFKKQWIGIGWGPFWVLGICLNWQKTSRNSSERGTNAPCIIPVPSCPKRSDSRIRHVVLWHRLWGRPRCGWGLY